MAKGKIPAALKGHQFAKGGGRVGTAKMAKPAAKPTSKPTSKKSGKK